MEPLPEVDEGSNNDSHELSFHVRPHNYQNHTSVAMEDRGGAAAAAERELVSVPATPTSALSPPHYAPPPHRQHAAPPPPSSYTPASTRPPSSYASPARKTPKTPKTPRTPWTPSLLSPIGTPMKKAMVNMKSFLEEVGHLTRLNPQDSWLPITESRTGNAYYATFHNLNAGIGFQGLLLPVALTYLGWTWGILALVLAFAWQLYTLWLMIKLHEAVPGTRINRYVDLAKQAFGERLGFWLATPPHMNLTAGTGSTLIIIGGGALKLFYKTVCGPTCGPSPLSTIEWYLVFTMLSIVLAQLPNLNSIAGVSLVGALTAVVYFTLLWVISISTPRLPGISYKAEAGKSTVASIFSILNALGIVAFAFRGHNLALEIQATMPSTLKHPAYIPMWRGAKVANFIIVLCYFPIAIAGYWAYGNRMLASGILYSMYAFHVQDISQALLAFTLLLVVINCLSSFQIYSITMFDTFEAGYTSKRNRRISWYVRVVFRVFYVFVAFFIGVALPFLSSLSGFLGGISSAPVTFAFPCFMWLAIKKPKIYSFSWYLNWGLGILGMILAVAFTAGGIWSIVDSGLKLKFFKPAG